MLRPSGNVTHSSNWGLIVIRSIPGILRQPGHVDLVVEVPDVADDRLVLHTRHLLRRQHILVAGRGDEDVRGLDHVLHRQTS
jgi:hypothetical protein